MDRELETLLELSQQLLARAEAGEWEAVERAGEAQRRRLQDWFAGHSRAGITPAQRRLLVQILDFNRRAERLARGHQDRLATELQGLKRGRRGAAAYAANS